MEAEFFLAPYKGQHARGANGEYSIDLAGPDLPLPATQTSADCRVCLGFPDWRRVPTRPPGC